MFVWRMAFINTTVNEKLFILNKTIVIILSKFIPHETFIVDDDDDLRYFTKKYKNYIQEKINVYKSYRKNKKNSNMQYLRRLKLVKEDHVTKLLTSFKIELLFPNNIN